MNIGSIGSYPVNPSTGQGTERSAARIASGERIQSAADDAAGLTISNRMNTAIKGYDQSIRNANDGISMLQTASASLNGVTDGVSRLRELALQAGNGTLNASDRGALQSEAKQLMSEIQNTVKNSQFNQQPLLDGGQKTRLQIGNDGVEVELGDLAKQLQASGFNDLDFSTAGAAQEALGVLDTVQGQVDQINAGVGASLNRLDSTINQLGDAKIATSASRSRIADADMAKEISEWVGEKVKEDVALAVQALANQQKGSVLRLLQN